MEVTTKFKRKIIDKENRKGNKSERWEERGKFARKLRRHAN